MPIFRGRLSTIGSQSFLNQDLLVMAGAPDLASGILAATQFLIQIKHFHPNQIIDVDGQTGGVGTVRIIVMTDAQPASVDSVAMTVNAKRLSVRKTTKNPAAAK